MVLDLESKKVIIIWNWFLFRKGELWVPNAKMSHTLAQYYHYVNSQTYQIIGTYIT